MSKFQKVILEDIP